MSLPDSFVDKVADAAQKVREEVIAAIMKAEDEAIAAGHSVLTVGDKTADALIAEVDERTEGIVELARAVAKAAVSPVSAVSDAVLGEDEKPE